jgi:uncharacterized membrane protein
VRRRPPGAAILSIWASSYSACSRREERATHVLRELVFLVHVPGSSYGPNAGALFETISRVGVDEGFRARVREALKPGTSAIGLLLEDEDAQTESALLEL